MDDVERVIMEAEEDARRNPRMSNPERSCSYEKHKCPLGEALDAENADGKARDLAFRQLFDAIGY